MTMRAPSELKVGQILSITITQMHPFKNPRHCHFQQPSSGESQIEDRGVEKTEQLFDQLFIRHQLVIQE